MHIFLGGGQKPIENRGYIYSGHAFLPRFGCILVGGKLDSLYLEKQMKKLIMITAMFMAMNTWGADYKICKSPSSSMNMFESCATILLEKGYKPLGSLGLIQTTTIKSYWYQGFYKLGDDY